MCKSVSARTARFLDIHQKLSASPRPEACFVAPAPHVAKRMRKALKSLHRETSMLAGAKLEFSRNRRFGFNDGLNVPGSTLALGVTSRAARNLALERRHIAGDVRVLVVLVEFPDKKLTNAAQKAQNFDKLFFARAASATSVRNYYREVTGAKVDIHGEVIGPVMMPRPITYYANGESATGDASPNGRDLARDAALAVAQQIEDLKPYDNNGDGFVEAFVIVHAGRGAEETGKADDIWSHKWVMTGSAVKKGKGSLYAYLTVPEDARLGVCAHELGHLLFGFPDLYDTTSKSEGVGDWCLMGGGSWLGGGDTPAHPSAWCKVQQDWVSVKNIVKNGALTIPSVAQSKQVTRLWRKGATSGSEYFLAESRVKSGYDAKLPGEGLLIWHIDEAMEDNDNRFHPKVGLVQADNLDDLRESRNRGDAGDPFPGSKRKSAWGPATLPNSDSYSGIETGVALTDITRSGGSVTVTVQIDAQSLPTPKKAAPKKKRPAKRRAAKRHAKAGAARADRKKAKPSDDKRRA